MLKDSNVFSGYSVKDLEEAKRFYTETLGLSANDNPMGLLELSFNNGSRVMIYPKENHEPATFTVLNFLVSDIEQTVDSLNSKGITMEHYNGFVHDEKGICRDGRGPAIAWFKDPAGNILSVIEES